MGKNVPFIEDCDIVNDKSNWLGRTVNDIWMTGVNGWFYREFKQNKTNVKTPCWKAKHYAGCFLIGFNTKIEIGDIVVTTDLEKISYIDDVLIVKWGSFYVGKTTYEIWGGGIQAYFYRKYKIPVAKEKIAQKRIPVNLLFSQPLPLP